MPETRPTLVLFARAPEPGSVKTRLAGLLSPDGAARLYRAFLTDAARVYADGSWTPVLYADGDPDEPTLASTFAAPWRRKRQANGDLGVRLTEAFRAECSGGADVVLAVGSDHPALARGALRELFDAVGRGADAALIPATDGGYCAIALSARTDFEDVFHAIPWSSDATLAATLDRMRHKGLSIAVFPAGYDVDRPEDLERLRTDLASRDPNDEDYPRATAAALAELPPEPSR